MTIARSHNRLITEELHKLLAELQFNYDWLYHQFSSPLFPGHLVNIFYKNNGLGVQLNSGPNPESFELDLHDLPTSFLRTLDLLGIDATATVRRNRLRALLDA